MVRTFRITLSRDIFAALRSDFGRVDVCGSKKRLKRSTSKPFGGSSHAQAGHLQNVMMG